MKISVIIPIYNGLSYIEQCLQSVKIQDVDMEIFLIDDCSTDGLEEQINLIQKKLDLNNLIYIRNKEQKGAAYTRNVGIKKATGNYIAFLDADDWWENDKLKKQIKLIEKTGADFVFTARKNVYEGKEKVLTCDEKVNLNSILKNNQITCSSVLIRSDIIKNNLMEHSELDEDFLTWIKILKEIDYAFAINEPLTNYRVHTGSVSNNKFKQLIKRYKMMQLLKINIFKRFYYLITYIITGIQKYK